MVTTSAHMAGFGNRAELECIVFELCGFLIVQVKYITGSLRRLVTSKAGIHILVKTIVKCSNIQVILRTTI